MLEVVYMCSPMQPTETINHRFIYSCFRLNFYKLNNHFYGDKRKGALMRQKKVTYPPKQQFLQSFYYHLYSSLHRSCTEIR